MLYLPNEEGQGLVEYALILVLVAIVVIAILMLLGPKIVCVFVKVVCSLQGTEVAECVLMNTWQCVVI